MKKDIKSSFCINGDLRSAAILQARAMGYPSLSAYLNGLIFADLITQPDHGLPLKMTGFAPALQGKIIASLLAEQQGEPVARPPRELTPDDVLQAMEAYRLKREAPAIRGRQEGGKAA